MKPKMKLRIKYAILRLVRVLVGLGIVLGGRWIDLEPHRLHALVGIALFLLGFQVAFGEVPFQECAGALEKRLT
jgi:hypothetical protein